MKLGRATKPDIDAIFDLLGALDSIESGIIPSKDKFDETDETIEISTCDLQISFEKDTNDYVSDECNYFARQALSYLLDIYKSAYPMRAAMNLSALLDPENEIVDAENPILEPHPNITQALKDTARLNWLEKQMLEDSQETIVCDGYNGFCTISNFREACPPIFENIRDAIDHEMKKQGD